VPAGPLENEATMNARTYLDISADRRIAYHRLGAHGDGAALPGVVFLGGFRSDMGGTKAVFLEAWARDRGRAYLRFDYRGHGESSGTFEDGSIGDWADDAAEVLRRLTDGPQVLVGSSMGGWIALLLARQVPERVAGLVGIAAAPDFTEDAMWSGFTEVQRQALLVEGRVALPSAYSDEPYVVTRRLIEEGRANLVLRQPLRMDCPVRLLQGTADDDVDRSVALRLLDHIDGPDVRLTLVKDADHRFSGPRELALISRTLDALAGGD
jgi:pimeloyl-ACP methyl ester carboxylesterase